MIKFAEMLSLIEKGQADGILSRNPDRLARNSVDGGKIIHFVDRGLIKALKFPTFWFEPTPQGLFMLQIAFGQSKYYVDALRENVTRGMRQKVRNTVSIQSDLSYSKYSKPKYLVYNGLEKLHNPLRANRWYNNHLCEKHLRPVKKQT